MKPWIHQFTNLKCCQKSFKPPFNGISFLIYYHKKLLKSCFFILKAFKDILEHFRFVNWRIGEWVVSFFFDVMNRLLDWSMTLIFCWVTNTQKKCWIENLSVVHLYHELRLPRLGWIWQPIVENRLYGSLTLLKINLLIFKALGFFFFFRFWP